MESQTIRLKTEKKRKKKAEEEQKKQNHMQAATTPSGVSPTRVSLSPSQKKSFMLRHSNVRGDYNRYTALSHHHLVQTANTGSTEQRSNSPSERKKSNRG
ncbi:hypothetical protein ASPWEDRAFT_34565 [Aspergillus wentii DTO 134E9]|uniref:Uncharacterized protein n=1 Tax=Aspergillus wentii DTO 134E9 TaxID=1073089 RepID=A0A1L9S1R5_ASPWE|nr:uncharacterized protein ASPWEDRAFT_34565 [Aspergillus wentii DTO 134E9]OJJ41083.1 hypothetical protein ASPWEDRAFT_34565 [Aspergillus wentii DTO 134E9]